MLIAGKKGHISTFNWKNGKLGCELFLNETVRDAKQVLYKYLLKEYIINEDNILIQFIYIFFFKII